MYKKKRYRLKDRQKEELLERISGNFSERLNDELRWFEEYNYQKNYINFGFGRKQALYNYATNQYWEIYEFAIDVLIEDLEKVDESL